MSLQHRKRRDRIGGMQIDQRTQCLGAFPEWMERRMIKVLSVGVAVDHGAAALQLAHGALQLVRGGNSVLHGQMREARIAIGPLLHFTREKVVGGTRVANGRGGVALGLHARPRQCENRAGNAGPVHREEAGLGEVGEARERLLALRRREVRGRRVPVIDEARAEEMLFQSDLLGHSSPRNLRRPGAVPYSRYWVQISNTMAETAAALRVGAGRDRWRRKFAA